MTSPDPYHQYRPAKEFVKEAYRITYESQITFAIEALKLLGLANGAAAIALLTFVGNVLRGGGDAVDIFWPTLSFAAGLFLCIVAFFGSYSCQMSIMKYWADYYKTGEPGDERPSEEEIQKWVLRHKSTFKWIVIGIVGSALAFLVGVGLAAHSLSGG